jgi:carbonic anhydrase/acetyltransferase-like protein (isoleucine patch superfamily)
MAKKYELTNETIHYGGHVLHRIKALINFGDVKAGQLGGWVESDNNLSQYGHCWVSNDAKVFGDAWVYGNALVCDKANVFGHAKVSDKATVSHNAEVYGNASIYGNAVVSDNAKVYGDAEVYNDAWVCGDAQVYDGACVTDKARLYGYAHVCGHAWVYGNAVVYDFAEVYENAEVYGNASIFGNAQVFGNAKVYGNGEVCGDEKVFGDISTPKNNTNMEKKYKVSIDITMSKDIYVDAENEKKAKQKAIKVAKENSYYLADSAGSFANCVVTNIVNEDENVRLWLISQLKIKLDATNSDKNDMINKALDYLEKQGGKSVK